MQYLILIRFAFAINSERSQKIFLQASLLMKAETL